MSYRPVVSSHAKTGLNAIRDRLVLKGVERLRKLPPEMLRPKKCPLCGEEKNVDILTLSEPNRFICRTCRYQQRLFNIHIDGAKLIELSTLLELGIAALAYELRY
jgi:hypothetical protein